MTNVSRRMFLAGSGAAALGTISTLGVGAAGAAEVCRMPKKWDHTYDVIVIGAGGAGMAAGITAARPVRAPWCWKSWASPAATRWSPGAV